MTARHIISNAVLEVSKAATAIAFAFAISGTNVHDSMTSGCIFACIAFGAYAIVRQEQQFINKQKQNSYDTKRL